MSDHANNEKAFNRYLQEKKIELCEKREGFQALPVGEKVKLNIATLQKFNKLVHKNVNQIYVICQYRKKLHQW